MVYYGNNTYQLCLSEGESQSVTDRVTRDSEKNKEHFITMHETQKKKTQKKKQKKK